VQRWWQAHYLRTAIRKVGQQLELHSVPELYFI